MPTTITLTPTQIDTLKDVAWQAGVEIYPDYSGRNMYGATCFGIVGTIDSYTDFVLRLVSEDHDLAEAFVKSNSLAQDDMGLSTIYYWTGIAGFPSDDE